jgi:hypothetical protein
MVRIVACLDAVHAANMGIDETCADARTEAVNLSARS